MNFAVFFTVALSLYAAVNAYIFVRGWRALVPAVVSRPSFTAAFLFLSLSYVAGRFLEKVALGMVSDFLVWTGSLWLALMFYLFLAVVAIDLARLANRLFPFFPRAITADPARAAAVTAVGVCVAGTLIVLGGFINTLLPRTTELAVPIDRPSWKGRTMTALLVSDVHLGTVIGRMRLSALVERINACAPDLVLLAGDILDEDVGTVMRKDLGEILKNVRARHGIYGITGNHEFIGGVERTARFLQDSGIVMLRDWAVKIDGALYLVGREDRSVTRFGGPERAPLDRLLAGLDRSLPVIVMDHQPYDLKHAAARGADLHLSGHTHAGQVWPASCIVRAMYEVPSGAKRIGATLFYVSTGYGSWGPPVRIGNRPEIVVVRLTGPGAGQKPVCP